MRKNAAVRDLEPVPAVEFPSPSLDEKPEPTEKAPLADLWLLWEERRFLYRVALWALLASTVIAFLIPRKYDSTVRIMPPDSQGDAGMMLAALAGKAGAGTGAATGGLASLAGSVLGMKSSGALFVDLLRSRTVQDHIIDRFSLQKVYWERYKQDAREVLDGRTDIKEDRKSGVITMTVRDRDPQRARDMARTYVDELDQLVAQVSTSSARRERIFIEQRLVTVKGDLQNAEHEFSNFASKNATLDIKEQTKAMVESAAIMQGQLIAAQSEIQSLEQIYTPNNVRVRAARARIDELKRQLQKVGGTDESLAPDAPQEKGDIYPSIRKLPLLGVQWVDLYRTMKIQETVYELLNSQYEMARIQEAKEIPTVRVVDPANVPEKKSFPPIWLVIAGLTSLSMAGAMAWVVGTTRWNQVDSEDPGKRLALSVWQDLSDHLTTLGDRPGLARMRDRWRNLRNRHDHS